MERREFRLNGGGTLTLREDGGVVQVQVYRVDDGRGLYKVWIHGAGGKMLLGTLVPEQGTLRLNRRLSRGQLERCGCWPMTGGAVLLAFSFGQDGWQREEHPERLVRDAVLRQALCGQCVLLRRSRDGFELAAQFEFGKPFPLVPLFCLSRLETIDEQSYVFFFFDRDGVPVPPRGI